MTVEHTYSISEVSKILEKTVHWLRWKEGKMIGEGTFVRPDGTPLLVARSASIVSQYSRRRYTIEDIEDMARLFVEAGIYPEDVADRIAHRINLHKKFWKEVDQ